jgi:hypothetical protein
MRKLPKLVSQNRWRSMSYDMHMVSANSTIIDYHDQSIFTVFETVIFFFCFFRLPDSRTWNVGWKGWGNFFLILRNVTNVSFFIFLDCRTPWTNRTWECMLERVGEFFF